MLSKNGKSSSMSDTAFVQETLRGVYTVERFGSVKAAQGAALDFMRKRVRNMTARRIRSFFEGTARIIRGEEKDAVRAAEIEEGRREQAELRRGWLGWMQRLPWPIRNFIASRARRCSHRWADFAEWIAPELRDDES